MHKVDLSKLTLNQLSELTGSTYRTVKAKLKGIEPVEKDGKSLYYNPREALPAILGVETALPKKAKAAAGAGSTFILQDEKARHAAAQADKTELEVRKLKGELLDASEVEIGLTKMVMNFRAKVLVLPARLAPELAAETRAVECQKKLRQELHEALEELSRDGAEFEDNESLPEGGEEGGASSEPEGERVGGEGEDPT